MEQIHYRGLLKLLRELPPPESTMLNGNNTNNNNNTEVSWIEAKHNFGRFGVEPVAACKNKVLIYDADALITSNINTFQALARFPYDNLIVVPEVVIDEFDTHSKREHKDIQKLQRGQIRHWKRVDIELSKEMRTVLLNGAAKNIIIQRIDQLNEEYLKRNNIDLNTRELHHIVACALFFRRRDVLAEVKKEDVVIVTDNEILANLAAAENFTVYSRSQIENANESTNTSR